MGSDPRDPSRTNRVEAWTRGWVSFWTLRSEPSTELIGGRLGIKVGLANGADDCFCIDIPVGLLLVGIDMGTVVGFYMELAG